MKVHEIAERQTSAQTRARFPVQIFLAGGASLFGFILILRLYEEAFGWTNGLDSFSPEFALYWGIPLQIAITGAFLSAAGVAAYLWRTRDRNLDALSPREELSRYLTLAQLLLLFALALYFGLSFFTEQTAVWHMTAVRDTDFTPSNIVTFYVSYPLFATLGVAAFVYARTRLPYFSQGHSLAFVILVVGTFMTIPNVGFNEWGHTFWFLDEGFAGPLHWGFVFFGWMALGIFGVVLQILARLRELLGDEAAKALNLS